MNSLAFRLTQEVSLCLRFRRERADEDRGPAPRGRGGRAPDSPELVEALVGEFVAGMAALACKVIADEQRSPWMSEHDRYYENGQ